VTIMYIPDFAVAALYMLLELREQRVTFLLRLDSEDADMFAMMTEMGFFAMTGQRYQMVIPKRLNMTKVKKALLRYAQTEDSEYILHPEHLVTAMPFLEAKACKAATRDARKPSQCGSTCPAGRLIACEDRGGRARRYWTGEDRNLRYYDLARTANLPAPPQ
jgi:hypothetical protein